MDITDAGAIRWVGEELRPVAERVRDLNALMNNLIAAWSLDMGDLIGSSPDDLLLDTYQDEATNSLTAAQINTFMIGMGMLTDILNAPGAMDSIHRASIRPMRIPQE